MKYKHNLITLISLMDDIHHFSCHQLLSTHATKISAAPGSAEKHQAWPGGFIDHLEETMNVAIRLYKLMNRQRKLPFSLSDCLLVLFLHDIEKPFKYTDSSIPLHTEEEKWNFLKEIVGDFKFSLTEDHWNALKYVHGEGHDYHPTKRIQGPLAAFVHICDTISARIWFDYPKRR